MAPETSTTGNKPENYDLISNLIALEEKKSNKEYRRVEARSEAFKYWTNDFFASLWVLFVAVGFLTFTPPFLITVGHLFSTDLSFREYMEFKPHIDADGYFEYYELFANWEIVMLWFFLLFIAYLGYKLWIADENWLKQRRESKDKRVWNKSRIWNELDTWNKKTLLDLAKEKELSPPLNMRSTKYDIIYELLKRISR